MIVKKISKLTLIIAIIGFCVSLYALVLHIETLMAPGGGAFCDVNAKINCSSVIGSKYGEFASIPLGAYGMAFFALIFSALITPKFTHITKKQLASIELVIALCGIVVVGILATISYTVLKIICPTCSVIHVLVLLYTILKIYEFFKARRVSDTTDTQEAHLPFGDVFVKFFAIALCLSIPPLFAGLMTPWLVDYFGTKTEASSKKANLTQYDEKVEKVVQNDLTKFNKTNYVGSGEDYRRGSDTAPIVVQIFSDFGCPHCKSANEALVKAQDIVGEDKVVLVYRFYPLSNECNEYVGGKGFYQYNCVLITAARCAGQQGKFWEFKEWAFEGQNWTNQERAKNFSTEGLKAEAKNLKMNEDTFEECIQSHTEDQKIRDDVVFATQLKIQGTPMIFINGQEYQGPFDENIFVKRFKQILSKG